MLETKLKISKGKERFYIMFLNYLSDTNKERFMNRLINGLNISESDLSKISLLLDKYIEVGKELYSAIFAE